MARAVQDGSSKLCYEIAVGAPVLGECGTSFDTRTGAQGQVRLPKQNFIQL